MMAGGRIIGEGPTFDTTAQSSLGCVSSSCRTVASTTCKSAVSPILTLRALCVVHCLELLLLLLLLLLHLCVRVLLLQLLELLE